MMSLRGVAGTFRESADLCSNKTTLAPRLSQIVSCAKCTQTWWIPRQLAFVIKLHGEARAAV